MGGSLTKSPLERRNTVLRRSQKKSIVQSDSQIGRLFKDIKQFRGIEEDEDYTKLKSRIEGSKKDLARKSKDLQPQVRILHARAQEKLNQADLLLESKLKENIEKASKKAGKKEKKKEDDDDKDSEANNNIDEDIEELERQRDDTASPLSNREMAASPLSDRSIPGSPISNKGIKSEQNSLINSTDKRKTVELNLINIQSEEKTPVIAQLEKSPQQKRRSIIKYGVQVLPTFNNEMFPKQSVESPRSSLSSKQSVVSSRQNQSSAKQDAILSEIAREVGVIEEQVSQFSGKKDGTEYNRLKEKLFQNLDRLADLPNKSDVTYVQLNRYVESCLSFLDERADARDDDDDEVFLSEDKPKITPNGYKITSI